MPDKHLPIQFFEKRKDFDDRSTEGGGGDRPPAWVLSGEALSNRSVELSDDLGEITRAFDTAVEKGAKLPLVVCTGINDKAIAKSHRSNVTSLYAHGERSNILGLSGDRCLLSMITDRTVFPKITAALSDVEHQAKLISSITEIVPFSPISNTFDEAVKYYKVRLINYDDYDFNSFAKILFEDQCREKNIKITRKTRYTKDLTIYRICLDSMEDMELVENFEGIYSIEKLTPIIAALDALSLDASVPQKEPQKGVSYPVVGVLDTGIQNIPSLQPWKLETKHTNYPDEYQDHSHGTFVSGIIEYGDELNGSKYTAMHGVQLFEAVVYPDTKKETLYVDELIEHIREAIESHNEIKVWNLSLGTDVESSLTEFSDFGMALDNIQDENNVLIVKSAGNCTNFTRNLPKSRIAESADSVRALVVGSLAKEQGSCDFAAQNTPSPFTRIGPGPSSIVKPDLVFYGGNAGMKSGQLQTTGVPSFSTDGRIAKNVGTSFSTPWVTRMAAELSYLVNDTFDPLFIRALMIHNAKYPSGCEMAMSDKVEQMGYGMPVSVNDMLYNSKDEATLILRDTLEKGSFIEMFDFPYPQSLVDENGFFTGQIIVTLVTKSLLDDKQAGEYCQSNIDVLFGTYETEKERDVSKPLIKNPLGLEEPQNVLVDSCYSTRVHGVYPKTGFERECTLVKYGKKFHPVKKYAIDLADMTPSNRERYLGGSRKWYLKVEGLYRDFIEGDAAVKDYQLSQEYCLMLTIRDPKGNAPVYDEVTQQLEARNFIHHSIRLRNAIDVHVE